MKRADIIREIHGWMPNWRRWRINMALLSGDFWHFYRAGELEQTRDFIRWAGFYEAQTGARRG
ncbi:MAG TPA: hypothetical protein VGO59_17070 [Verrucomicrobiae bacterium]